ncbi:pyrimidine 5'-nucleotidase [Algicola sagamiensis]|uniref:pyrimidine 5'-nucleotidase n=1 Tax=Algicola sagamiensis TaxID=163869 RepID=UPI0003A78710|nr:pyrimidine 5'-nucleotidase [Algicola sagamiensis]
MNYSWILFDADDTLFHFDAYEGLKRMFANYQIDFTKVEFLEYQKLNLPLWVNYQDGKITAQQLKHRRFELWSEELNISTQKMNLDFLDAMADVCYLLPGAEELLNTLQGHVKLGIITNGFTALQEIRLARAGLQNMFDHLIISEEVGIAKPDKGIFEHAFQLMNHPPKSNILMVGDNPHSDILGGMNAGIHTCWLNPEQKDVPEGITPHYQVQSLYELNQLLHP